MWARQRTWIRRKMFALFWWENLKKRESLEDLCIEGSKMLKCFCSGWVGVDSVLLAQGWDN